MGVATFVLDSFGPRGLTKVYENKLSFTGYRQIVDAVAALDTITRDGRIDHNRVGAMGRSLGGETSVYLSLQAPRSRWERDVPVLSLALAITPGCTSQERDARMTPDTEVHFFLAEKDLSPHERCIESARRMNQTFLRKVGIEIGFDREGRARTRIIQITTVPGHPVPEQAGARPSTSSVSSASMPKSNPTNDFAAQPLRTVANGADGSRQGNAPTVRANPLKSNGTDDADGTDANPPFQSAPKTTPTTPSRSRTAASGNAGMPPIPSWMPAARIALRAANPCAPKARSYPEKLNAELDNG